jgi:ceramide glucosyltransferase
MLEIVVIASAVVLGMEVLLSHLRLSRAARAPGRAPKLVHPLSVSVIRPIKGLDPGARENLATTLGPGYPGEVETLFVFDDETEPALPVVRELLSSHLPAKGRSGRILFSGDPPRGRTGKLNAMIAGLRRARGEIIVFADSDIRPGEGALEALVATLLSSRQAGSAFAPVYVPLPFKTAGDAGYALLLNGLYGPAAAFAAQGRGGELPFIMGQFMAFTRSALSAIGGLESAEGQLVDDMYLGARINAVGLKNRVSPVAVPVVQEGLSLREFAGVYFRWILFSRSGLPDLSFKLIGYLHGLVFWAGLIGLFALLATGHAALALLLALAPLGVSVSIGQLHRALGGAPLGRFAHVAGLLLLAAPLFVGGALLGRRVTWRGRSYSIGRDARLSEGRALEASESPLIGEPLRPEPDARS